MYRSLNFKRLARLTFIVAISVVLLLSACNNKPQNSRTVPPLLPSPNSDSLQPTPTLNGRTHQDSNNTAWLQSSESAADSPHISLPIVAGSPGASINSLTITPEVPTGREALTVSWDVSDADLVLLELSYPGRPPDYLPPERVTSNGSRTFLPPHGVREIEFILWVNDEIRQSVTVALACEFAWFSSSADERYCPHSPVQQFMAVYQPFEQGYMISRQNYDYIWFYFGDNDSYYIMPDSAAASEVPFTESTPPGLFRPANSFGRIWEANPSLRERLGWATEPAQSYTMTYQQAPWLVITESPLYRLFTLPDGTVIGALIDHRDGDGYSRSLPDPSGCYLFTYGIGEPFAVYAEPEMPPMAHLNIFVPANVYLPILAEDGQWLQIRLPDGQPVWIISIVGEIKGSCDSFCSRGNCPAGTSRSDAGSAVYLCHHRTRYGSNPLLGPGNEPGLKPL